MSSPNFNLCPARQILLLPVRQGSRGKPGLPFILPMACVGLTACGEQPLPSGPWLLAALALTLAAVAFACYALGQLRGRRALEGQLRAVRQELRLHSEQASDWRWASDARHQLLLWQAPSDAPVQEGEPSHAARELFGPVLLPRLQAQATFTELEVTVDAKAAHLASRCWRVRGSPRVDDAGRFDGFVGTARPMDALQAAQATACSLATVMAAHGSNALAWKTDAAPGTAGYVLQHLSPAAQAAWPGAAPGQPLTQMLRSLPHVLGQAVAEISGQPAGTTLEAGGWHLLRFDAGPGRSALWLSQAGSAAPGASTSEAEQFSMTVSHDLRAPIRVVEGFTRIVKEDYGQLLDRVGNDHLDRVLGAATRMNLMIDALLTLARLSSQPLARQPVNLSQLALYVVDDLRRGAPDRVADIEIEPGLHAHGDPTLLRLVLENLLGNAWKYTSRAKAARIVLRQVGTGPQRVFEVQDNGAGFDMRSAERLFGLFQRLHSANEFPGHGVGLASVKRIVQRHGGDIWAEAEPGRGACFHFTLAA